MIPLYLNQLRWHKSSWTRLAFEMTKPLQSFQYGSAGSIPARLNKFSLWWSCSKRKRLSASRFSSSHQESNLDPELRRLLFYPLNYGRNVGYCTQNRARRKWITKNYPWAVFCLKFNFVFKSAIYCDRCVSKKTLRASRSGWVWLYQCVAMPTVTALSTASGLCSK